MREVQKSQVQQLSASVCRIMKCTYNVTCIAYLYDFLVIADSFSG